MSRTTYAEISLRVVDKAAKSEAIYEISDSFAFSNLAQIKDANYKAPTIWTFEHNLAALDGNTYLVPSDATTMNWGLWSNSMTDEDGDFITNPSLTCAFTNIHTTSGITVTFGGDCYAKQTITTWYSGTTVLSTHTDTVSDMTHFIDNTVENWNKIIIEFVGTSVPYRRIKINEIDFGQVFVWGKADIISAELLEEVNLTSEEITINTLEFSIKDINSDFSMLNPSGIYNSLQSKQDITVTGYINNIEKHMGKFYLDTWENTSSVIASFEAYDAIGLFDSITYKNSSMWSNVAANTVFADIFSVVGWTDYNIEAAIANELISGYIPVCTVREALHQLCFACRCSCIPDREGIVQIKRLPSSQTANTIEKSQKLGKQKITQNTLINSVAVTGYSFTAASTTTQLYNATLDIGTYSITWGSPSTSIAITGATINSSGLLYANITVAAAGTVAITGYVYESATTIYTYEGTGVTDSTRSQATVDGIYLVSSVNGLALAQFVYEDYQRRIVQSFSMAIEDEVVGDNADVDTMLDARKTGVITKLDIDLTGGFIADTEIRG